MKVPRKTANELKLNKIEISNLKARIASLEAGGMASQLEKEAALDDLNYFW
jgi:hypothetical protein